MEQKILEFWKLLANAKNILLINHVRMDPDCFWSLTALYLVLEKMWYNVTAINDDKNPKDFSFLEVDHIINPELNISEFNPDLIISLDAASLWQLWDTYINNEEIFKNTDFVVFDHHVTNPGFWSLNIIDTNASSTCEILFKALETLWLDKYIDSKIATLLTAWIHTDTNIFYNANTTPETLRTAAKLMEFWADFRLPMYEFYKKKTFKRSKLWWEILKDIQQTDDWKITYAIIKEEYLEKTDTSNWDSSWVTNEFLANMDGSDVCFMLYSLWEGKIKWSMRSKSINVSALAQDLFWWGWHKLAAWFTSELSMEETTELLLKELKKLL